MKINLSKILSVFLVKREEEIYILGKETTLKLSNKNKGRLLLHEIRDEAHRFAISYQRLRRFKK